MELSTSNTGRAKPKEQAFRGNGHKPSNQPVACPARPYDG